MRLMQKTVALVLAYVMLGLLVPAPALAAEANLVNPALLAGLETPNAPTIANPDAGGKQWSQGGKIMTIVGIGMIGVGAFMMTRENSTLTSSCSGNVCTETQFRWKVAGGITMGGGGALVILGLLKRH